MKIIHLHPQNPQPRLLKQIAESLENGQIIAYPTAMGYALLTHPSAKNAIDKIAQIDKTATKNHHTLLCASISDAANYAEIDNEQFRQIKNQAESSVEFLLIATKQTPKYLLSKDKAIGIQIVNDLLTNAVLEQINSPLVIHELNHELLAVDAPYDIEDFLNGQIDILVDAGGIESQNPETINLISE